MEPGLRKLPSPLGAEVGVNKSLLGPSQEYLNSDLLGIRHVAGFLSLSEQAVNKTTEQVADLAIVLLDLLLSDLEKGRVSPLHGLV